MVHNSQCSDWLVVVKSVSVNAALNGRYLAQNLRLSVSHWQHLGRHCV